MDWELSRLAHGADEDEQGHGRDAVHFPAKSRPERQGHGNLRGASEQRLKLEGAVEGIGQHDAGEKDHIAESEECKGVGGAGERRVMPVVMRQEKEKPGKNLPKHK